MIYVGARFVRLVVLCDISRTEVCTFICCMCELGYMCVVFSRFVRHFRVRFVRLFVICASYLEFARHVRVCEPCVWSARACPITICGNGRRAGTYS